ncbi:MAG: hypothetical protein ABW148_13275 [Sedimenticola sp.]
MSLGDEINAEDVALCIKVLRAALAQTIADTEELPLADIKLAKRADISGQPHLALVDWDSLGWPMGDAVVALLDLMEGSAETGITNLDLEIDRVVRFLYNRLLNISPPFQQGVSVESDNDPLNVSYEDILRTAQFAGHLESHSSEVAEARSFLYPVDDAGIPRKSDALVLYEDYENRISTLELETALAHNGDDTQLASSMESQLKRVRVEWLTIGQKNRVEKAISLIIQADADAGFEDERIQFIETLERSKRDSINSGEYASVAIRPLSNLIDPNSHWSKVALDAKAIRSIIDTRTRVLFEITAQDVERALQFIGSVTLEYTVTILQRAWLKNEFLQARYWRHPDKVLSDGHGGGLTPTVTSRAVFIRKAEFKVNLAIAALESRETEMGRVATTKPLVLYKKTHTPLLNMLAPKEGESPAMKSLSANMSAIKFKTLSNILKAQKTEVQYTAKLLRMPSAVGLNKALRDNYHALAKKNRLKRFTRLAVPRFTVGVLVSPVFPTAANPVVQKVILTIRGMIKAESGITPGDIILTRELISASHTFDETPIPIRQESIDSFKFSEVINSGKSSTGHIPKGVLLRLRDRARKGSVISEKSLYFGHKSRTEKVTWRLFAEFLSVELCSRNSPTLMGYGLEILPKSPNPDESLIWE